MDLFPEIWQSTLSWQPSPAQLAKFQQLYDQVLRGNQVQNLTRVTEPIDFWEKHLWDSLRGIQPLWGRDHLKVIDVGTGAGFPGLPIAIVQPQWQLTLLDATRKKIRFVNETIQVLQLTNTIGIHGRAEELTRERFYQNQFDLVLIRAVGSLEDCLQYGLPLTRSGGQILLYRGHWDPGAEKHLQGMNWQLDRFVTPISYSQRSCVYITTSN